MISCYFVFLCAVCSAIRHTLIFGALLNSTHCERYRVSGVSTDETIADETIADETIADETIADETIADETIADETIADETIADETIADYC